MHHGTCVTHVPWCMSGSLTHVGGENVPGIPGACASAISRIWQEAHVPNSISRDIFPTNRFPDDIFQWISLNEDCCTLVRISLTFVFKSPINNKRHVIIWNKMVKLTCFTSLSAPTRITDSKYTNRYLRPPAKFFYFLMMHHGSQKKITKFKDSLSEKDWTELLKGQSATEMCNVFHYHINNLFDSTFPIIRLSR